MLRVFFPQACPNACAEASALTHEALAKADLADLICENLRLPTEAPIAIGVGGGTNPGGIREPVPQLYLF